MTTETKICRKCQQPLPIEQFYLLNKEKGYRRYACIGCTRKQNQAYVDQDPAKTRKIKRVSARKAYHRNVAVSRQRSAAQTRQYNASLKAQVVELLGGKCACGISDPRILQIDHVHNGGTKHRRDSNLKQPAFLRHVLKSPPGVYQLLCAKCNWRKRLALVVVRVTHTARHSAAHANRRRSNAIEMLGGKCRQCPETDPAVLQFDHIHGGGRQDRQKVGRSTHRIANDVLKNGTAKYQLLCVNCNQLKRHTEREYPHKYEVVNV